MIYSSSLFRRFISYFLFAVLSLAAFLFFYFSLARCGGSGDPWDSLGKLVIRIESSELESTVRELSGADSIHVGGETVLLRTRYAKSEQKYVAMQYLLDEITGAGYEPFIQTFILGIRGPDLSGLAVSSAMDTVWAGDFYGKVYRAVEADGWDRFQLCGTLDGKIFDLKVGPRGRLWAAGSFENSGLGALFVSDDGGSSWQLWGSGSGVFTLYSIAFEHGRFGIVTGASGTVLRTGDWGDSWWPLSQETFHYHPLYGSATNDSMHFWIVSRWGYLYESTNAGGSWTETLFEYSQLYDIDFYDVRYGVIVGSQVAYYTKDGGVNWNEVTIDADLRSVSMVDSLMVVAAGGGGEVWLSNDGGAGWTCLDDTCTGSVDFWSVAFAGRERFWLAGRDEVRRIDLDMLSPPDCRLYRIADTTWGKNIGFRLEGKSKPDRRIVLSAHYDSYSSIDPMRCAPGADDNASGVAGVLECARALEGAWTERTIEFLLFDGEELGCRGSIHFVDILDTNATYESVINLDMLGYDKGNLTLEIAGRVDSLDSTLSAVIIEAVDSLGIQLAPHFLTDEVPASDHRSFWDLGIPSVLLIEGKRFEYNPFYHSGNDVAAHLDYDFMASCTKAALGAAARLAGYRASGQDSVPSVVVELYQNHPNPFYESTVITFSLPGCCFVEVAVYDVKGQRVKLLKRGWMGPDEIDCPWDGSNDSGRKLASGVYFLRLKVGAVSEVRKIVILR